MKERNLRTDTFYSHKFLSVAYALIGTCVALISGVIVDATGVVG